MTKCDNCTKSITKRAPGLECRNCGKIVHASQFCSGLLAKHLSSLHNSDSIEWTCAECQRNSPNRKSSFIVPDEDDDNEEEPCAGKNMGNLNIDTNKFLKDITIEIKKILKTELQTIETSVVFCCNKIDDLTKTVETQNKLLNELEKKCHNLKNENTHLGLEIRSLTQHVHTMEQQRLENVLQLVGVPKTSDECLDNISIKLAETLNVDKDQISTIKRLESRTEQDSIIQVEFKQAVHANKWIRASKNKPVLVEELINKAPVAVAKCRVVLRRALTKANKSLLWQAQQKLRPKFMFVWFQSGKVLARRGDNDKPMVIRCEDDIINLLTQND